MTSRKNSTSTDESSASGDSDESGSSSDNSSSDDSSGSGSTSSDSGSSSSSNPKTNQNSKVAVSLPPPPPKNPRRLSNNSQSTSIAAQGKNGTNLTAVQRRRNSETRQQKSEADKLKEMAAVLKPVNKTPINRSSRLSKSSEEESNTTTNKTATLVKVNTISDRRKPISLTSAIVESAKKQQAQAGNTQTSGGKALTPQSTSGKAVTPQSVGGAPLTPQSSGGKAPPSVVKQHQQQQQIKALTKTIASTNVKIPTKQNVPLKKNTAQSQKSKEKSVFSPEDNSSDSENRTKTCTPKTPVVTKTSTAQAVAAIKKKQPNSSKKSQPNKKSETKISAESSSVSSSSSGGESEETESSASSNDSESIQGAVSPRTALAKKKEAALLRNNKQTKSKNSNKTNDSKLNSDQSDHEKLLELTRTRKLTRSSSTRKSKHLFGKSALPPPSDTDSDTTIINKSRSTSKSPVKKASTSLTKSSKAGKKIIESKPINQFVRGFTPVPDVQKCLVEGCDSTGHLNGVLNHHFLSEACPIFHNMSIAECKDRAIKRKLKSQAQGKLDLHKQQTFATPEQKLYLNRIRESRAQFKPIVPIGTQNTNEKCVKTKFHLDTSREPKLIGFVPEYDFDLFREAQAIASEKIEKELKDTYVGTGIKYITMGKYEMKVWYQSPYPEDVPRIPKMYICEFCLRYQRSAVSMKRHTTKCVWRHPPGNEIYRKGKLQVWQVDGRRYKLYCQHLCLLAKFFLDHKTLYYDVEPFLFYVMTIADSEGCHTVGYFSKEKNSFNNYNVSCILTLPPYQRKGYGRLLIDFSYLLTRVEGKIGSPEKPLSDLGLISYRSYWKDVLLDFLCTRTGSSLNIKDLSQEMAIYSYDIVSTLQALGMMKYWKGKHIVLKKQDILEEYEERVRRRGDFPKIDANCLRWKPFVIPHTGNT